jgi:hypothetical protein
MVAQFGLLETSARLGHLNGKDENDFHDHETRKRWKTFRAPGK